MRGAVGRRDLELARDRGLKFLDRARNKFKPGHGEASRDYGTEHHNKIIGSMGEVAYARHFNLPLPDPNEFGQGDFGDTQVRSTHRPNGRLIVFDKEDRDRLFVLVVVSIPATADGYRYRIAGELHGSEVSRFGFRPGLMVRPDSPPQLWVNQGYLHPHQGTQLGLEI